MEIHLDELKEGDVLLQSVRNESGQIIVSEGVEIIRNHIDILKTWKIETVTIRGENQIEKRARERLEARLDWSPENSWEQELFNIGLLRACELVRSVQGN